MRSRDALVPGQQVRQLPHSSGRLAGPALRRGFTIVELLIVIVVIAILAAISIVAYNGIQNRAYNSSVVSVAKSYYNALALYAQEHDAYPSGIISCLGAGYDSSGCWPGTTSTSMNATLAPYMSGTPTVPEGRIGSGTQWARGVIINANSTNALEYAVKGSSCPSIGVPISSRTSLGNDSWCRVALPALR